MILSRNQHQMLYLRLKREIKEKGLRENRKSMKKVHSVVLFIHL